MTLEEKAIKLAPGTQIIYVPTHAENDTDHPDCQAGFVSSQEHIDAVFCRYWKHRNGKDGILRTMSCSELTPLYAIVVENTVPQSVVENALKLIKEQI